MIEITVNNTVLLLDPKTKVRMEWNSPIFAEDVFEGNKLYWFDIPFNPINNKAFNHSNILGMSGKFQTYPDTKILLLECIELKGTLIVNKIIKNFRVAFTTNDLSQYRETLLTDFDWGSVINLGTTTQDVLDSAKATTALNYPNTNYNFPEIFNPDFYGDTNLAFEGKVNTFELDRFAEFQENLINTSTPGDSATTPHNVLNEYNLSPQFYLQWMLSELSTILGFTITGDLLTNTDLQQILVYNGYAIDDNDNFYYVNAEDGDRDVIDTNVLKFTTIDKGSLVTYDGKDYTVDYGGYISFYLRVKCTTATPGTVELKISLYNLTTATEITNETIAAGSTTAEEILFFYHDEFFKGVDPGSQIGEVIQMRITSDTSWVIEEMECNITNLTYTNLNRYAKEIDPSNHVPKMKLNDFMRDLKDLFGAVYFIDNNSKSIQISLLKDVLNSEYLEITNKIATNQEMDLPEKKNFTIDFEWDESDSATSDNFLSISEFTNLGVYPQIKEAPQPTDPKEIITSRVSNQIHKTGYTSELREKKWLFYSDIEQKQIIDNGADDNEDIEIKASPILMYSLQYFWRGGELQDEQLRVIPQIRKKGVSKMFITEEQSSEDKLRLMNWVGVTEYEAFKYQPETRWYPFATSFNYDMNNVKQKNITLFLEGEDGLYNNFLKEWYNFISHVEEVKFKAGVNFGTSDLFEMIQILSQPQLGATALNIRWIMIESIKYLLKQVTVEISMNGLESVEIKGIKKAFD